MKNRIKLSILLLIATLLIGTLSACFSGEVGPTGADVVVLQKGQPGEVLLLYGEPNELSTTAASNFRAMLSQNGYQRFNAAYHYEIMSESREIIIGNSDRAASKKAADQLEKKIASAPDDFHWAFCYDDGKLAIIANSELAYDMAFDDLLENYVSNGAIVVKDNLNTAKTMTIAEYNAYLEELVLIEAQKKAEENKQFLEALLPLIDDQREELSEYMGKISPYSTSDTEIKLFAKYTKDIGQGYWGTSSLSVSEDHPRLLITSDSLPRLRSNLSKKNAFTTRFFEKLYMTIENDCILPEAAFVSVNPTLGTDNVHNYDDKKLEIIQAKALGYLAYGDEFYGYQAIYYMKNFIKSLDIKKIASDQCREYGYVMYTAAIVYDWCYDLLTEEDKVQFIAGVENCLCRGSNMHGLKMEVGFPPSGQGSVVGHSCEYQILRDYLSFSIAIYDENSSWWNFVAARICNDFAPMRNHYVQSGIIHQGVSYAVIRHGSDLFADWLIQAATGGQTPFVGIDKPIRGIIGSEATTDYLFTDGDCNGDLRATDTFKSLMYIVGYVYGDGMLLAQAEHHMQGKSFTGSLSGLSNPAFLALSAFSDTTPSDDRYEGLDLIQYHGAPLGQYVVRASWTDENSASVFMRIKERSTGNHEHSDAGTFQIYYKGMLTSDGGVYNDYNSTHNQYFHQATISHNGLIIYNSAKKYSDGSWYSGGQRKQGNGSSNYNGWLSNSSADTGKVVGRQHGYSDDAKAQPLYAYIAGDITKAYDSATVSYAGRRMLTVYTGDEEFPMAFFVYDDITSTSTSHKKRFLLQISSPDEPTISSSRQTVITENGDGRLVLTCLTDGVTLTGVGGRNAESTYDATKSSNYIIEGKQLTPKDPSKDDGHWGRVEVEWNANTTNATFMNVIYVTDKGNENSASVRGTSLDNGLTGGTFDKKIVGLFATSRDRANTKISCKTAGSSSMSYYVSGVAAGEWTVTVDGKVIGTYTATEEGGLLTFTAPAGEIVLTPKN